MAATAMVVSHEISFPFPSVVTKLVNEQALGFDLFDIE